MELEVSYNQAAGHLANSCYQQMFCRFYTQGEALRILTKLRAIREVNTCMEINFYNIDGSVYSEEKDEQQRVYQLQALAKHASILWRYFSQ